MNNQILQQELKDFTGTEGYHKHYSSWVVSTDGVMYLAKEAEAYWLVDAIASYQAQFKNIGFQVWTLKVNNQEGVLTMREDDNQPILVEQNIEYTDFPLEEITLWLVDGVLLLPSEY